MTKPWFAIGVLLLFLTSLVTPSGAQAQSTGTWVSGVGDDANPCSRTAPCKTFAGAISKTAPGGVIRVLDPGGFGVVTITKAITIEGTGSLADILGSGTNGVIVNAPITATVVLRGINIRGLGTGLSGIRFLQGGSLIVEDSEIDGFTRQGIEFTPNADSRLIVENSTIRGNVQAGILLSNTVGTAFATISRSYLEANGDGIRAASSSRAVFSEGVIAAHSGSGVHASGSLAVVDLEDSSLVFNGTGVATGAGGIVRLSNVDLLENGIGIDTSNGGTVGTWGNNRSGGNATPGAPTQPPMSLISAMTPLP